MFQIRRGLRTARQWLRQQPSHPQALRRAAITGGAAAMGVGIGYEMTPERRRMRRMAIMRGLQNAKRRVRGWES